MADHWHDLIANLAVVALFIVVWVQGKFLFAGRSRRGRHVAFGTVMGVGAVASMILAIPIDGFFIDTRLSLVALSGFFGGPLAAVITVVVAIAYRSFLGGPAVFAAACSITGMAVVAILVSRLAKGRLHALVAALLLSVSVAAVTLTSAWLVQKTIPNLTLAAPS